MTAQDEFSIPKSPVQQKLDDLRDREKAKVDNAPLGEKTVDLPPDIDMTRFAEVVKDIKEVKETMPAKTILSPKGKPVPSAGEAVALVLSVTDVPFTPSRSNDPQPLQKYQILIEMAQPLQGGKEYRVIL